MKVLILTNDSTNPENIEKIINEHLDQGWELHGDLKVISVPPGPNGRSIQRYTQAVKK